MKEINVPENYRYFIAKSGGSDRGKWLPLYMHLRDTAGIAEKLATKWVPESTIAAAGLTVEDFTRLSIFLAGIHDIGKATVAFQNKILQSLDGNILNSRLAEKGYFVSAVVDKKLPHAKAGGAILKCVCDLPQPLVDIVCTHHGKPLESEDIEVLYEDYSKSFFGSDKESRENWKSAWIFYYEQACSRANIEAHEFPQITMGAQVILSGLLVMADWIASNTEYFPLIDIDETGNSDLYPKRVNEAWNDKLNLPMAWETYRYTINDSDFLSVFGFPINQF